MANLRRTSPGIHSYGLSPYTAFVSSYGSWHRLTTITILDDVILPAYGREKSVLNSKQCGLQTMRRRRKRVSNCDATPGEPVLQILRQD